MEGTYVPSTADGLQNQAGRAEPSTETEFVNSIGMKFARIPAGEFIMGLPNEGNQSPYPQEAPAHKVRITRPYMFGVHEVTQKQFEVVMGYNPSSHVPDGEEKHAIRTKDTSHHPVENVTWYEAIEFCEKLGTMGEERAGGRKYRLPTEAEWEHAARAGRTTAFPFTSQWDDGDKSGIIGGKNWKEVIYLDPVGSYPANDFGVHDMCGSVFEWTNDWFGLDYYSRSPVDDPQGPEMGYLKVVRGWYWVFTGPSCVANAATPPWKKSPYIGFRVVAVTQQATETSSVAD
jgi:formylglycine-generating enzyme required for sulfatase activity